VTNRSHHKAETFKITLKYGGVSYRCPECQKQASLFTVSSRLAPVA